MHALGRFLQFAGLIILPLALVLSMVPSGRGDENVLSIGQELLALAFGAAVFWVGRLLEGYAKR
jgi:hypothetical protein